MFTGIVRSVGTVAEVSTDGRGSRLAIVDAGEVVDGLGVGDSIAVNGVCLTATSRTEDGFVVDAVEETLSVTNLGSLVAGSAVNLERPLAADGRFDGHVVQGHVDGIGRIRSVHAEHNATTVWIDLAPDLLKYCIRKGSITVDGISLTIAALDGDGFAIAIVPHTWTNTNLASRVPGDAVNIETDVLAKYVERLLGADVGS